MMVGVLLVSAVFGIPTQRVEPAYAQARTDNLHPTEIFRFSANARSVAAAFNEADRDYYLEDEITAFPDPTLGLGGTITVRRALPVEITDGKKTYIFRTWEQNVGALLDEKNIELGSDDQINLAPTTPLVASAKVTIVRVAITTVTHQETIAFGTTKKDDPTLDKGKTRVSKAGVIGRKELVYEVRREDGAEVSRVLKSSTVVKQPENEVVLVGTKPVITGWCKYNDWVLDAAIKNGADPDLLCRGMRLESNGNPDVIGSGIYHGLFQYELGLWNSVSAKAGFAGASWRDPKAQIYTTAWAITHGYRSRWFWAK